MRPYGATRFVIYAIPEADGSVYVGCTTNPRQRLHKHRFVRPGQLVQMVVLEVLTGTNLTLADVAEAGWMRRLGAMGFYLSNRNHMGVPPAERVA